MKRALAVIAAALVTLAGVMAYRAATIESRQPPAAAATQPLELSRGAVASRFAGALTFPTVSHQDPAELDESAFLAFHDYLRDTYPLAHATLARETVGGLSLLYTWDGLDPELDPVLLMGHMDVVPVIPGTEDDWTYPPFGGVIADGQIWGRGALDDKSTVVSMLEAVEHLVDSGFRPRRTVYLAFGHDEEVGGYEGAAAIAESLEARGAEPYALVMDEGGIVADGLVPGLDGKVALIGIGEKGFVSLELLVRTAGGHSSAPPESTSIGILARAIRRLEEGPFPARLDGATEAMFRHLAPEMPLLPRLAFANLWLTRPLVTRFLLREARSAALVRTTTATTIVEGGVKENVLPIEARAVVNFRTLPGDTRDVVVARARRVVDDDRVQIGALSTWGDPPPVSEPDSEAFQLLGTTLHQVMPGEDVVVAPYLLIGGSDAKHYAGRSPHVFRFLPVVVGPEALQLAHGTNERITVDNLALAVRYMAQLIRNSAELP